MSFGFSFPLEKLLCKAETKRTSSPLLYRRSLSHFDQGLIKKTTVNEIVETKSLLFKTSCMKITICTLTQLTAKNKDQCHITYLFFDSAHVLTPREL